MCFCSKHNKLNLNKLNKTTEFTYISVALVPRSICYTKQVVIEQDTIGSVIMAALCTCHNDRFGHILHQKPSRKGNQVLAVFKQEPDNGGFLNIYLIYFKKCVFVI